MHQSMCRIQRGPFVYYTCRRLPVRHAAAQQGDAGRQRGERCRSHTISPFSGQNVTAKANDSSYGGQSSSAANCSGVMLRRRRSARRRR